MMDFFVVIDIWKVFSWFEFSMRSPIASLLPTFSHSFKSTIGQKSEPEKSCLKRYTRPGIQQFHKNRNICFSHQKKDSYQGYFKN